MRYITLIFAGTFLIALFATHRARAWGTRHNLVDIPDGIRRRHDNPVPRIGGVAVFAAVTLVLLLAYLFNPELRGPSTRELLALFGGGGAMFVLGLTDDLRNLRARTKLLLQVAIAVAVYLAGLRIETITPIAGHVFHLAAPISLLITVLWIVGLANAFNLIDGSDGVAAGAALFASMTLAVVAILSGNLIGAAIALALAGATLGFLFFNFPPATIFLGDSGSLFLGYTLAAVGILSVGKAPTVLAVTIPVVSCGLPILDTLLAMVRRFLRRDPILLADRGHIHHRLRDLGHSPRGVALVLYAGFAGFAMLSLLLVQTPVPALASVFIIAGAIVLVAVQRLKIPELLEVGRIVERGLQQRQVIANNVRIRHAVNELRGANDPTAVLNGLRSAFAAGEFSRVELCLYGANTCFDGTPHMAVQTDGRRLSQQIMLSGSDSGQSQWELQLPLRGADNVPFGHLSLWHNVDAEYLLTDVRLLAVHLQPELVDALRRLNFDFLVPAIEPAPVLEAMPVSMTRVSHGTRLRLQIEQ